MIANSCFDKKEKHLIIFRSAIVKTQIDYFLLRRRDWRIYEDCNIILSECFMNQHRSLVMDMEIKRTRKKRTANAQPMIRWWNLTTENVLKLRDWVSIERAWEQREDANIIWSKVANITKGAAWEVLEISK